MQRNTPVNTQPVAISLEFVPLLCLHCTHNPIHNSVFIQFHIQLDHRLLFLAINSHLSRPQTTPLETGQGLEKVNVVSLLTATSIAKSK
jgi:hypothetical protein